jgi:hypothetical protein
MTLPRPEYFVLRSIGLIAFGVAHRAAFLERPADKEFVIDPRLSNPWKR